MKVGPDIARVASLIGDPARANMLTALMRGGALTASELAEEAGVTRATASAHLARLDAGGLIAPEKQGRHRYFRLLGADVAELLEKLMGVAARSGDLRVRPGPKDPALRHARICYDHLAGELGVLMFEGLRRRSLIGVEDDRIGLSPAGERFFASFGVELGSLARRRRPLCRRCLDWSERRSHLAGSLGAAILERVFGLGWARLEPGSRLITFSRAGEASFRSQFEAPVAGKVPA